MPTVKFDLDALLLLMFCIAACLRCAEKGAILFAEGDLAGTSAGLVLTTILVGFTHTLLKWSPHK